MSGKIKRRNRNSFKGYYIAMALVLILGCAIGGTLAWLLDSTDEIVNTFTPSDINITLTEDAEDFKMIPGWTIEKDPVVTVKAGSEACYLFVEVTENLGAWADNLIKVSDTETRNPEFKDYLNYSVVSTGDKAWTAGTMTETETGNGVPTGVYFIKIANKTEADTDYQVLTDNKVTVDGDVTKEMMGEIDGVDATSTNVQTELSARPTLIFKAYAVQLYESSGVEFDPDEAWAMRPTSN